MPWLRKTGSTIHYTIPPTHDPYILVVSHLPRPLQKTTQAFLVTVFPHVRTPTTFILADPGLASGQRQLIIWQNFPKNERIWTEWGCTSLAPLDPLLILSRKNIHVPPAWKEYMHKTKFYCLKGKVTVQKLPFLYWQRYSQSRTIPVEQKNAVNH